MDRQASLTVSEPPFPGRAKGQVAAAPLHSNQNASACALKRICRNFKKNTSTSELMGHDNFGDTTDTVLPDIRMLTPLSHSPC